MFHTALIIGPWILEWNNSSLCIPRRCCSTAAILAIDVDNTIEKKMKIGFVVDALCEVISRWNIIKTYDRNKCNCLHFIEDVLDSLGISSKLSYTGALGNFIKNIREKGSSDWNYSLPEELIQKCHFKNDVKNINFKTHEELDNFVLQILEYEKQFNIDTKYAEDFALLKSVDRAFWLRYFKKNEKIYKHKCEKESEKEEFCLCPFGDPRDSKSILGKNDPY